MADHDISKMKVADLKRELKVRGLNVTGNKNDLVERLQSALIDGDVFDENVLLDDNDDVLNDDELEEDSKLFLDSSTAADEDVLLKLGDAIGASPDKVAAPASGDDAPLQKKVVLKRKSTSLIDSTSAAAEQTGTGTAPASAGETVKKSRIEPIVMSSDENGASNGTANGKPVTKWSELSEKELQEMRAKKFGGAAAHDEKKVARAERFGLAADAPAADAAEASAATTPEAAAADAPAKVTAVAGAAVDALKKRAERFGGSVSKTMVTIENKAKLLKRQERFATGGGGSSAAQVTAPADDAPAASEAVASAPVASAPVSEEQAKRLQARLDRFKTAA